MNTSVLHMTLHQAGLSFHAAIERIHQLETELERLKDQASPSTNFLHVYQGNKLIRVAQKDVSFLKAESNYCHIYLINGAHYYTSRTLKAWAKELPSSEFLRCHRSYLVRKSEILQVDHQHNEIVLINGQRIGTSRRMKRAGVLSLIRQGHDGLKPAVAKPDHAVHKLTCQVAG